MPDISTIGRLGIAAGLGVIAGIAVGVFVRWASALTVGWDTAALVYCVTTWAAIWPMDAARTEDKARAEDPNRAISDVLTLSAAVASLASIGVILINAHNANKETADLLAGLALLSIAISWFTVHTIFALRYARLYYGPPKGGVDFNQSEPPVYKDFCYLALTIGMTFQVSDTSLRSTALRAAAMRHALLSYLFGTVILAAAINLIAGLA